MTFKAALLTLLATPAIGANCLPSPVMESRLSGIYGESETDVFTDPLGETYFQMFFNEETGSWTLTQSKGGVSCIRSAGGSPVRQPPQPKGEDS